MKRIALFLLATLPVFAHADIVDIQWQDGAFTHKATVAPKKILEACGKLSKGERVKWSFEADAKTDFNIHYHVGKDVVYPERRTGIEGGGGTLAVVLEQDYCWMWRNTAGAPVSVSMRLAKVVPIT
jgi:hypothetical protein